MNIPGFLILVIMLTPLMSSAEEIQLAKISNLESSYVGSSSPSILDELETRLRLYPKDHEA